MELSNALKSVLSSSSTSSSSSLGGLSSSVTTTCYPSKTILDSFKHNSIRATPAAATTANFHGAKAEESLSNASTDTTGIETPELSMVLEKAQVLLNRNEFAAMSLLLSEYDAREISVDVFVKDLLSLISDKEKVRMKPPAKVWPGKLSEKCIFEFFFQFFFRLRFLRKFARLFDTKTWAASTSLSTKEETYWTAYCGATTTRTGKGKRMAVTINSLRLQIPKEYVFDTIFMPSSPSICFHPINHATNLHWRKVGF